MSTPSENKQEYRRPYVNKDLEELEGGVRALTAGFFLATVLSVLVTGIWLVNLLTGNPQVSWDDAYWGIRALVPAVLACICLGLGTWSSFQSEKAKQSPRVPRYMMACLLAAAGAIAAWITAFAAMIQLLSY